MARLILSDCKDSEWQRTAYYARGSSEPDNNKS